VAGAVLVAAALVALLGAGGCSNDKETPPGKTEPEKPSVELAVTPADKAADVPVSAEIAVRAAGGKVTEVALADAAGEPVDGEMRDDGSAWVPAEPLAYTTTYTAKARPGNRMGAHIYMADNATYGQAMPVVVEFRGGGVPEAHRATVERRLFVRSDPPQEGAWHWDSDIQAEYRPREYWQPGTKLNVRLGLGGLPIGDGRYGEVDITIAAQVDSARRTIEVANEGKRLTAMLDGRPVKTMPVSLGKPSAPSFSGTMVIMEELASTVFDSSTYGTPVDSDDGYRTKVKFAQRLTWDGQFIHAAPWSVASQGKRNVSHGCVNLSTANARWLYDWAKVGDPVTVKGTERQLKPGNGWTAWNLSWEDFKAGSALTDGEPTDGDPAGGSPTPSASPTA
jgi:lipoprotein-anchoring transpeptidase ErfK/SrfK